jgi:hypothetical protein
MIAAWLGEAKAAMLKVDKEVAAALIGAVIGSILSFTLLVLWDIYKRWRDGRRSVWLVREEVEANLALAPSIRNALAQEIEVTKDRMHIIGALPQFAIEAWQTTLVGGGFPRNSKVTRLAGTYRRIVILNQKLQARELFKATNQAMSRFGEQLAVTDEALIEDIDKIADALRRHREELGGWRMVIATRLYRWFGRQEATTT